MYVGGGRLTDVLGTARGFTLIMVLWSLACASHGFATGVVMVKTVAERMTTDHRYGGAERLPEGGGGGPRPGGHGGAGGAHAAAVTLTR
jgi:hypothetical protein